MNKKYIIIFVFATLMIVFLESIWFFYFYSSKENASVTNNSWHEDPRFKVEGLEETSTPLTQKTCPLSQELDGDICKTLAFTKPLKSEIIFNSEIKKDKHVEYLRKTINNFLSSGYVLDEAYENLIKIDLVYLKSKFIIISADNNMFGGKDVLLISKNKPDKIFLAWVYGNGENESLTLRSFKEISGPPCISDIQKVAINQLCDDNFGF